MDEPTRILSCEGLLSKAQGHSQIRRTARVWLLSILQVTVVGGGELWPALAMIGLC